MVKKGKKRILYELARKRHAKSIMHSLKQHHNGEKSTSQSASRQHERALQIDENDNVLLVGEGDFSFALSLEKSRPADFSSLTATTIETREHLFAKYPQAKANIENLSYSNTSPSDNTGNSDDLQSDPNNNSDSSTKCRVLYSVDARKLSRHPLLRNHRYSKIIFNFPHVGGKSTDVNRQVRYNQELIYAFLQSCRSILTTFGRIFVTLFEGEPYTLWNVKDLARSAGLTVRSSFAFDFSKYPGYSHVRTLGNLNGMQPTELNKPDSGNNRRAAWRGEDRSARTYEFCLTQEPHREICSNRKRNRRDETSSDND